MFDRITFDPMVMVGRACLRGMPITLALVVYLVANRMFTEDIIREHLSLKVKTSVRRCNAAPR